MLPRMWRNVGGNVVLCTTYVENRMEIPQKLKAELTYDPVIPLMGTYLKKTKTLIRKDTCTPVFTAMLFTIAKIWKQPMFINRWMDVYTSPHTPTHTHTLEYYSIINKKTNSAICKDLENITLVKKVRQGKTNTLCYHLCAEPKKILKMNVYNNIKKTDSQI